MTYSCKCWRMRQDIYGTLCLRNKTCISDTNYLSYHQTLDSLLPFRKTECTLSWLLLIQVLWLDRVNPYLLRRRFREHALLLIGCLQLLTKDEWQRSWKSVRVMSVHQRHFGSFFHNTKTISSLSSNDQKCLTQCCTIILTTTTTRKSLHCISSSWK